MLPQTHLTPDIRKLVGQRKIHEAYLLAVDQNPPANGSLFSGISEQHMEGAVQASTPALSFCSEEQLFELQTVLAMWYADCNVSPRSDLPWNHPMPPKIALHTLATAYKINYNLAEWKRSGLVLRAEVQTSRVGACPCCARMAGEYDINELPVPPFPGCTNMEEGCRCIIVGTEIKR